MTRSKLAFAITVVFLAAPAPVLAAVIPFAPQQIVSIDDSKGLDVVAGDIDGDGDLDLVVRAGTNTPSGIYWFENLDGAGTFSASHVVADHTTGLTNPVDPTLVDMDGDGDLDVLTGYVYEASWYPNDGLGNFGAKNVVRDETFSGAGYVDFSAGDLDGDGDPDVIGLSSWFFGTDKLVWYTNNGGGSFNPASENLIDSLANGDGAGIAFPADVDGDGDLDIVATQTEGDNGVVWYRNTDGAGTFSPKLEISLAPLSVYDIAATDVDGDGDLDVVSVDGGTNHSRWHENTAGDGSTWADHDVATSNSVSFHVSVTDMDLDGDPDVLLGTRVTDEVRWIENAAGDGSSWINRTVTGAGVTDWPLGAIGADVDGDGDTDVVTASLDDNKFAWFENRTIHRNAPFASLGSLGGSPAYPTDAVAADLDRDGDPDAVLADRTGSSVIWYENNGPAPFLWTPRTLSAPGNFPDHVTVGDIDRDGDPDIALSPRSNAVDWLENDGATPPGFTVRTITGTLGVGGGNDSDLGDIDRDGDLDLIALAGGLGWYENDGNTPPGWTQHVIEPSVDNPRVVELADIDGDGDLDALTGVLFVDTVAWYENDGATPPGWTKRTIANPQGVLWTDVADLDRDGDLDVAATSTTDGKVYWYENDGASPPAWTTHDVVAVTTPRAAKAVDFDLDGDLDFVSAPAGGAILWHENNGASPPQWATSPIPGLFGSYLAYDPIDYDGDGDPDLLATKLSDALQVFANRGGQYKIDNANVGNGTAAEGEQTAVLATTVRFNGRPGDSVARFGTIELLFRDQFSGFWTTTRANNVVENLLIYRDTGSGSFEPGEDTLVQTVPDLILTDGALSVALPIDDPNLRVAAPATFFVVAELTSDAAIQIASRFQVEHLTAPGSAVFDASAGIQLTPESITNFNSQLISPLFTFFVDVPFDGIDTNPGDGVCNDGSGNCTLRAAVMEANAFSGDQSVYLPEGTFTLSLAGAGEDGAQTGDLDVTDQSNVVTIVGAGAGKTVIDGGGVDRVFHVALFSGLAIEDLTVTGGDEQAGDGGGAIGSEQSADIRVERCEFVGNHSTGFGGAIDVDGFATASISSSLFRENTGSGDAIHTNGGTTIVNCTFSNNDDGAGPQVANNVSGTLLLDSSTVTDGFQGLGGGGSFTVRNSIVSGNTDGSVQFAFAGAFTSGGHNFLGNAKGSPDFVDGANGDIVGGGGNPVFDAQLEPLGDNGGPTLTHALAPTSPAIDAGSCGGSTRDQRGQSRPIDVPGVANADDGCDMGALESKSGPVQERIEVPVRWCGLRGAPSIENPSLVGETSANDVLRKRHERASDSIYTPLANIAFRSAGNEVAADYPLLEDPDCVEGPPGVFTCDVGQRGDVYLDLDEANFEEFQYLVTACRRAWEALDPDIQGVAAVHIDRFVDENGTPLEILGVGGRAGLADDAEQAMGGRVMVVDNVYRLDVPANPDVPNPPDPIDRLLAHELGHALSLEHGDGVDNDQDGNLDNDDDKVAGLPRFDGPNLMQYRNGAALSVAQIERARGHMENALPDIDVQPVQDAVADAAPIEPENKRILQFGYDGLTELENARILQFENASVLQFENARVLQFENKRILQFENKRVLQFENKRVLQFGMDYSGTLATDRTRISATMGGLPWPAAIRPTTRYFFYLDLDRDDATGGYPPSHANPALPGSDFPGRNNVVGQPHVAAEAGIDLIVQVELSSSCPGESCSSTAELKAFDFNDGSSEYDLVLTDPNPNLSALGVELYLDNGGLAPENDNVPTELLVQPEIENSLLFAAGWGFATPGGGGPPVPGRVRMEVLTTVDCVGHVLNDDPSSAAVDCQCADCVDCPDYPGCVGEVGTPKTLSGTTILADDKRGELTFEPPVLPTCVSIPRLAAEASALTVRVTQLPDDVTGTVEVAVGDTVVGTQAIAPPDGGTVDVAVLLPAGVTGPVRLSSGIAGRAPRADCIVQVTPTLACGDNDGDGSCDIDDPDDDDDGVPDGSDSASLNPFVCRDTDGDGCDDCASGTDAPFADGPDYDLDGLCDAGDPDDDDDGIPDGSDGEPTNANACGDSDLDACDDCVVVSSPSPGNDGPDADADGLCDFGDPDDDDDGTADAADCAPFDATLEGAPVGFAGLALEPGKVRISWGALLDAYGSATTVDLVRGNLSMLPVGSGAEVCLLNDSAAAFYDDGDAVAPGTGYWYLVKGENACGAGDYGDSDVPRTPTACP